MDGSAGIRWQQQFDNYSKAHETSLDDLMLAYKIDLIFMHHIDNDALTEHIERFGIDL